MCVCVLFVLTAEQRPVEAEPPGGGELLDVGDVLYCVVLCCVVLCIVCALCVCVVCCAF